MIAIKSQEKYNNEFVEEYKNLIIKSKINIDIFISNLIKFEKNDIDDKKTKNIISQMINKPYYENLIEINLINKFKLLIKIINDTKDDIILYRRLNALKEPQSNNNDAKIQKLNNKKNLLPV